MRHIEINLENLHERYSLEYVAKAANGAILYQNGGSVLLASVCTQEDEELSEDFVPLSVQYIEKSYAKGKFPAGFIKREGKPSEFEILTSRLIDRTLRPLFPKGQVCRGCFERNRSASLFEGLEQPVKRRFPEKKGKVL